MSRPEPKRASRALVLSLSLAGLAGAAAFAAPAGGGVTYHNARYGYSVTYPAALFTAQPESANGDGRVFRARNGGAEFRVWANYAAMNETPAQLANEAQGDCLRKPASYRVAKANLVAVSCDTAQGVLYEKELIHGGLVTAFQMTYPAGQRAQWDPITAQISGSLKAAH